MAMVSIAPIVLWVYRSWKEKEEDETSRKIKEGWKGCPVCGRGKPRFSPPLKNPRNAMQALTTLIAFVLPFLDAMKYLIVYYFWCLSQ